VGLGARLWAICQGDGAVTMDLNGAIELYLLVLLGDQPMEGEIMNVVCFGTLLMFELEEYCLVQGTMVDIPLKLESVCLVGTQHCHGLCVGTGEQLHRIVKSRCGTVAFY
jgi:hypothetical protein